MLKSTLSKNYLAVLVLFGASALLLACGSSGGSSDKNKFDTSKLIGSWYYSEKESDNPEEQYHIVLTFLDDKTYVIANDEDDEDGAGEDGFEAGTYTVDKNGVFKTQARVDNNGEWGFSHPCDNETVKLEVINNGNTLKVTADGGVGDGCTGDGGSESFELSRVTSSSNALIGSWLLGEVGFKDADEFALATFLNDGTYMLINKEAGSDDSGIERGTFEPNPENNEVLFTVITDTNGEAGFSHPCSVLNEEHDHEYPAGALNCGPEGTDIEQTLEVDGDTLTFISEADTIANDDEEQPVVLKRVK